MTLLSTVAATFSLLQGRINSSRSTGTSSLEKAGILSASGSFFLQSQIGQKKSDFDLMLYALTRMLLPPLLIQK